MRPLLALLLVTLASPSAAVGAPASPASGGGARAPLASPFAALCRHDGAIVLPRAELQAGLDAIADRPHGGLRIVPSRQADGRLALKLFGIRPGTVYAELGLQSGDVLLAVNGFEPRGVEDALAAYEALRDEAELHVTLSRRGELVQLWLLFP